MQECGRAVVPPQLGASFGVIVDVGRARLLLGTLAVVVGLASIATSLARASTTVLALTTRPTPVSAFGGVVAWSSYSAGAYHLMVRLGGVTRAVSTASEPRAFDASVGPGPGGTEVVFSRCKSYGQPWQYGLPGADAGCRIYAYSPRNRRTSALSLGERPGESLTFPSVWQSAIAVIERHAGGRPVVTVVALASRARSVLPGGTITKAPSGVTSLQMIGHRVAIGWRANRSFETEIVFDSHARRTVLAAGNFDYVGDPAIPSATFVTVMSATLKPNGSPAWVEPGSPGGPSGASPSAIVSYSPATGKTTYTSVAATLLSVSFDAARMAYAVAGTACLVGSATPATAPSDQCMVAEQ
jgi:hypothetical protein